MSQFYEVELKYTGDFTELQTLFNSLLDPSEVVVTEGSAYLFRTTYFDTPDSLLFRNNGYSLRLRDKAYRGHKLCVELKQIIGDSLGTSTTRRLELAATSPRSDTPIEELYQQILDHRKYPPGLPKPQFQDLRQIFFVDTYRREMLVKKKSTGLLIEIVLDNVEYKDGSFRTKGYDAELEIEIKDVFPRTLKDVFTLETWVQSKIPVVNGVMATTVGPNQISKAERAYQFVYSDHTNKPPT